MTAPAGPILHRAANPGALADELSSLVASQLRSALLERGRALLVVSGGTTPVPVWQRLCDEALDWSKVTITLADERWTAPTEPASNERLVREHLLQGPAAAARFVPLFNGCDTPGQAQPDVEAHLRQLHWPADVLMLGMGGDGHTASWFPGRSPDARWDALCMAVEAPEPPNVPLPRLSLTPSALLDARHLILHLTGQDKEPMLAQALVPGDPVLIPVRRALHDAQSSCHVFFAP